MTAQHHSVIGLPLTGKTTFLAALWHLINAGEVETTLVLDKLVGDHKHLNSIVESWRRCEQVPRTSVAAEATVSIHAHEPRSRRKAVLSFPDLSGESFDRQVATRTCRKSYMESYDADGGILLFVSANRGVDGLTILDLAPVLAGAGEADQAGELRDWSPNAVPEQVRLVELLQFLQQRPFRRVRRRVAVIVSAWDVIPAPRPLPHEWLARELPLLHQFLVANSKTFDFRVYGVSAQGGDITTDQRVDLLRKTPSERIECYGPDATTHDLTIPIVWLMFDG